jgi:HAD superfamily hydrolase (TIGR01662 family)
MNKKVIIFDFDGTLADSFSEVVKIYRMLSREYGLGEVKEEDIPNLRKISSRDFIKKFNFSLWRLPFLLRRGKKEFYKIMPAISLFPGIREMLAELKAKGCVLGILSSNSEENIKKFLSNNQVEAFDFIHAENNLFGKDKALKRIIKKYKFDSEDVFYVGDETRDIEAAKKCGIKMISVSWGFNDREILKKYNPDYLIDSPKELIKIFD